MVILRNGTELLTLVVACGGGDGALSGRPVDFGFTLVEARLRICRGLALRRSCNVIQEYRARHLREYRSVDSLVPDVDRSGVCGRGPTVEA